MLWTRNGYSLDQFALQSRSQRQRWFGAHRSLLRASSVLRGVRSRASVEGRDTRRGCSHDRIAAHASGAARVAHSVVHLTTEEEVRVGRPTSFRLSDDLLERLDAEAAATGTSVSALVASVLDEGLETRQFPGIVYRDGPAGRRAGLLGGPDVWEVVRAVRGMAGQGEQRLRRVAAERALPVERGDWRSTSMQHSPTRSTLASPRTRLLPGTPGS